jgi:Ca2+:H+ antiporter
MSKARLPRWSWAWPAFAVIVLLAASAFGAGALIAACAAIALFGAVFAAVYHAEVVAHRVGEPFGTLVLALAVTLIETALIVSIMIAAPAKSAGLARDTVFAAVMIVSNGIVGLSLLVGASRHREQRFQLEGTSAALAVLVALTSLVLVLPNYTTSVLGPLYSTAQLMLAGLASLVLYGAFVFVQTVRHRDYFLPLNVDDAEAHATPPSRKIALMSAALLVVALVAIVGLAKSLTPTMESAVARLGVPEAVVGIIIAALVLMPEGLAAVRAAIGDRLQTSLNLALGSSLATIGLTIPAVVAVSIVFREPLELGLQAKDQLLLILTLFLAAITLGTGRTTVLQGVVHLVVFAVFLFFAVVP